MRDADTMLARLSGVEREFEKGAPVPHAARQLLIDVVDALADSGPFELGVDPGRWLSGIRAAQRGIAAAEGSSTRRSVRRARKSIRELRRLFGDRDRSWTHWLALLLVWLVLAPAVVFALPFVPLVVLTEKVKRRYVPDVRKVVTALDLRDRALFARAVKATASAQRSATRARFGAYVHPVLVATDRHLVLAEPSSELPVPWDQQHFSIAWEVSYSRVRSITSKTVGGESPMEVVSIETPERAITYKMPCSEGKALLAVLRRRAPEALDKSSRQIDPYRPDKPKADRSSDHAARSRPREPGDTPRLGFSEPTRTRAQQP